MEIVVYAVLMYLIGNFMTAYFLVKIFHKENILQKGSNNIGARNAGRLYGKTFFILTFIGDACKGILAVMIAVSLDFSTTIQLLGLGMAILGHVNPVILRFHGGKGISTFLGGILAFEPLCIFILVGGFLVSYVIIRSFTLAGLVSLILIPFFFYYQNYSNQDVIISFIIVIFLLFLHRSNIRGRVNRIEEKA